MAYYQFKDADRGDEYNSFQTYQAAASPEDEEQGTLSWYWWECASDGGYPAGPFRTEQEAIDNANE